MTTVDQTVQSLVVNKLTREQAKNITRSNTEIYEITDACEYDTSLSSTSDNAVQNKVIYQALANLDPSIAGEGIPKGAAIWSDHSIGSNWITATSDDQTFSSDDYPDFYDFLVGIKNGTIKYKEYSILTTAEKTEMLTATGETLIANKQKIAGSFIIDTTNHTFILPRYTEDSVCLADSDKVVVKGNNQYGGSYQISAKGAYTEVFLMGDLKSLTREETVLKPVEIAGGSQILFTFTVTDDELHSISCPECTVQLFKKSSKGNFIYNLQGFKDGASYAFFFPSDETDINIMLLTNIVTVTDAQADTTNYEYEVYMPWLGQSVQGNNTEVNVNCELRAIAKDSIKKSYKQIPTVDFIPVANASSPEVLLVRNQHISLKKVESSGSYSYQDDIKTYSAGTYTSTNVVQSNPDLTYEDTISIEYYKLRKMTNYATSSPVDADFVDIPSTLDESTHVRTAQAVTYPLSAETIKDSYISDLVYSSTIETTEEGGVPISYTVIDTNAYYPQWALDWTTQTTQVSVAMELYDESFDNSVDDPDFVNLLEVVYGDRPTWTMIKITACTLPPAISEYNNDYKLYIKVK